jgi:hypothetical protein
MRCPPRADTTYVVAGLLSKSSLSPDTYLVCALPRWRCPVLTLSRHSSPCSLVWHSQTQSCARGVLTPGNLPYSGDSIRQTTHERGYRFSQSHTRHAMCAETRDADNFYTPPVRTRNAPPRSASGSVSGGSGSQASGPTRGAYPRTHTHETRPAISSAHLLMHQTHSGRRPRRRRSHRR